MKWWKDPKWWELAFVRMVRTLAQGALAGIGTSATTMHEVNWIIVASTAVFAGICSLITSVAFGIPEYEGDEPNDN